MSAIALTTRGLAFTLLLIAVLGKVTPRTAFDDFVNSLPVPHRHQRSAAAAIIAAEGVSCAALLAPLPAIVQYAPAGALFAAFAVYVIVRYGQNHTFDCHCFGSRTKSLPAGAHVAMNLLVFIGCAASALQPPASTASIGDVIFYTGAGGILGLIFVVAPTLSPVKLPR